MGNTQGRSPEGKQAFKFWFKSTSALKYLKFKCDTELWREILHDNTANDRQHRETLNTSGKYFKLFAAASEISSDHFDNKNLY